MYKRIIKQEIKQSLFKGKVIIIAGARQTGKTTLSLEIINELEKEQDIKIFNGDNPTDRDVLSNKDLEFLIKLTNNAKIILIDEGQKIENIGQTAKLLVDHYKETKQIIITGSSSFNLLDQTAESLTGRKFVYNIFPLSLEEIYPTKDLLLIMKELEFLLIYGNYPEIVNQTNLDAKRERLKSLSSSYLYKDILEFQQVKNSNVIFNLLKALALQIGSEVSYNELANTVGVDKKTVERYIDLLEKNFIIFRLPAYAQNKRQEISRMKKIYFYDLGIRNAVINNFNFLNDRNDAGALWENLMIVERLKYQSYHKIYSNNYFWRAYDGAGVDFVEERDGKLFGFEFKWNEKKKKTSSPAKWQLYKNSSYQVITPQNMDNFVL